MIKLIASDLDGTLLTHGAQSLSPGIYDLILKLKERGIHFVSASGRELSSQRNLFKPIADEISYIADNGAICVYQNKVIASSHMDKNLASRIIQSIKEYPGCTPLVSGAEACFLEPENNSLTYHIRHVLHSNITIVDDFSEVGEPIIKIALFDNSGTYKAVDYFKEKFQKEIQVVTSGNNWVDFVPFGVSKGAALRILSDKLGISPDEIIAFGDEENDLEMLSFAGKSYAMVTAKPRVKKMADATTETVEEVLKYHSII